MVELVWDAERTGTARGSSGASLLVGDHPSAFSPDDLVAMAAAACLMRAFLRVAAERKVAILGYMATAHLENGGAATPRLHLRSYVVGSGDASEQTLAELADRAVAQSPIARLLGDRRTIEWDLRVLHGA
jgi:organic hydroperoxide reductase OsmC/OhrA